ncbi:F-box only protein 50 [Thalassophryne amazonica]|uniref:F-box only protein 50 n=1 Tax=Thalassophryne amazonica TaxID=390379 RepID=UPI001470E7C0|nr:F-box only protein 50 [Thalassophryne amazonica]
MSVDWKSKCAEEWSLHGAPMPDSVDWKSVYEAKPLGRNLLKNPAPHGVSKDAPPPEPELSDVPTRVLPFFPPEVDFSGWTTNTEKLPYDTSDIPPGVVVCGLPAYSWFSMEQVLDLKAEGLWEELLDDFQPEIFIQDWYEESQLHKFIYELCVKLLAADKSTVLAEHSVNPTEDLSNYSHTWKEVSHVFRGYGPGVRYVHFLHRLKNQFLNEFFPTLFTDSSVIVRPNKSSC